MLKKIGILGMAAALLAANGAQADESRGLTLGVGGMRTEFDLNPDHAFGLTGSDRATGWQTFVGWRFNQFIAVEGLYADSGSGSAPFLGGSTLQYDAKSYGLSAVGSLPIGEAFAVYARAGYVRGEADIDIRTSTSSSSVPTDSDETALIGVGLRTVLDGAQIRLEYDRADFELTDTQLISLSVAWIF
jgi:OmpA-OmpF porin, OOP family